MNQFNIIKNIRTLTEDLRNSCPGYRMKRQSRELDHGPFYYEIFTNNLTLLTGSSSIRISKRDTTDYT